MFFSTAYAQGADPAAAAPNALVQLAPLVFIFVIFYFLLIRPQQQARKKHMEMVANVRRGDTVVTAGGITARVSTRIGQGVVNGLFMIRLGLGAMDACRACTFRRVARPKVLDLARRSLSVLRQTPAA